MLDIKSDQLLYPYRIYLKGGHVIVVWLPFEDSKDCGVELLKVKKSKTTGMMLYGFRQNLQPYDIFMDASEIVGFDRALTTDARSLDMNAARLKQAAQSNHVNNSKKGKVTVGQTVKKTRN